MTKIHLKELQSYFIDGLLGSEEILNHLSCEFPTTRIGIYRNTVRENLRNTLQATYKDIWTFLGDECANNIAYAYLGQLENFPKTGCQDDWGKGFINFLKETEQLIAYPYVKDIAELNWLRHNCFRAAEKDYCTTNPFLNANGEVIKNTKIQFQPHVVFYKSDYPLENIFAMLSSIDEKSADKDAHIIIARVQDFVKFLWLPSELWEFLFSLQSKTIEKALKLKSFDINEASDFLLLHRLLVK